MRAKLQIQSCRQWKANCKNDAQEETISIEQLFARTDRQAGSIKQAQP